jgi:hypothetical protein
MLQIFYPEWKQLRMDGKCFVMKNGYSVAIVCVGGVKVWDGQRMCRALVNQPVTAFGIRREELCKETL